MNITIQQRRFTFRSEYDISSAGSRYFAQKKFFSLKDKIQLMRGSEVLVKLNQRWSFFRSRYDFEFLGGKVYHFECVKRWKGVFLCEGSGESYHLYRHKGLNYSIFQSDRQIAAFTKNAFKVGKGDRYDIRMNDDANILIVICLALTVDASANEDNASVTFDLGNIGPEDRPFNESWQPD